MMPQLAWATGETLTGDGTADNPYQISDVADLKAFRNKVNEGATSIHAKLMDNINLNNEAWTPISNVSAIASAFAGTFDGNGKTISGLYVNATAANQGLFGLINGATIQNLKVEGTVYSTKSYVGGIVGKVHTGTIENCGFGGSDSSVESESESGYVGGIVGGLNSTGVKISGCYNKASVTGKYAGGILGYWKTSAEIENCYNTGTIRGSYNSAGITGQLSKGRYCAATICSSTVASTSTPSPTLSIYGARMKVIGTFPSSPNSASVKKLPSCLP